MLHQPKSIFVLTGAGISAESGIKTFRAADGLWENHPIEDVATPEGFIRNPELVLRFYNERRRSLQNCQPNPAHHALVELEQSFKGKFLLVTQNVDDLHERSGSKNLLHMHGELLKVRCGHCHSVVEWKTDLSLKDNCGTCAKPKLRPHIVWFGEMPFYMDEIFEYLNKCDLFISIGTSGNVYPAAGFSQRAHRAHKIEVNLEASLTANTFDEHRHGQAGVEVPKLVRDILYVT
jgi:NAD-dependent deacetylase